MSTLHIDFQEGFLDDTVVVRVNDEEYFEQDIRTRLQTGYAGSLEIDVREGRVDVEVNLPSKEISKSIPVVFDESDTVYMGVSVNAQGEISERVSHEPFGYV
jgi:UDP-galactopyranose mutase